MRELTPAAERMRRHRERRRKQYRCLTIELHETEIDALIQKGLLRGEMRNNDGAIIDALHAYFDRTLAVGWMTRNFGRLQYSRAAIEHRRLLRQRRRRITVEEFANECVDVRELRRAGIFRDRWVALEPSLRWPAIEQMRVARYRIQLQLCNQIAPQQIPVSWTPCNYGGTRPWMHCPHCDRRVAILLRGMGGYFCRACVGNPIYESQRRSKKARAYLQAYRLRQRLGGSRPVLDPAPARPYGMKRSTYGRICAQIEKLERQLVGSRVVRRATCWIRPLTY